MTDPTDLDALRGEWRAMRDGALVCERQRDEALAKLARVRGVLRERLDNPVRAALLDALEGGTDVR